MSIILWSSIMTSDAMKAANSIGIASVAGYKKYDLSHIQNAVIEKNEKGKLKIEPIKEEEIELKAKKIHKARMSS
jgi:hypothetical protein